MKINPALAAIVATSIAISYAPRVEAKACSQIVARVCGLTTSKQLRTFVNRCVATNAGAIVDTLVRRSLWSPASRTAHNPELFSEGSRRRLHVRAKADFSNGQARSAERGFNMHSRFLAREQAHSNSIGLCSLFAASSYAKYDGQARQLSTIGR